MSDPLTNAKEIRDLRVGLVLIFAYDLAVKLPALKVIQNMANA